MGALSPVDVSSGAPNQVTADKSSCGAVKLANESNFAVRVSFASFSDWLPAWTVDVFYVGNYAGYDGVIHLSMQQVSTASQPPSATVLPTTYAPGETITGTYPCALVRMVNQGNATGAGSVANVINDGNAANTTVIETTETGSTGSNGFLDNTGRFFVAEFVAAVYAKLLQVLPGALSGADSVVLGKAGNFFTHALGQLKVDGTIFQAGAAPNSGVFVDGVDLGNGSKLGTFGTPSVDLQVLSNGVVLLNAGGKVVIKGASTGVEFQNAGGGVVLAIDQNGAFNNPTKVAAGVLMSGKTGARTSILSGTTVYVAGTFSSPLSAAPTGMTFSAADFAENMSGLGATFMTTTGFAAFWLSSAGAGQYSSWVGNYTTSGNCIYDLDTAARTFTHHCEECGQERAGLSLDTDISVTAEAGKTIAESRPGAYGLTVACPCGARESFNTGLSAADEQSTARPDCNRLTEGEKAQAVRLAQHCLGLPMC